MRAAEIEIRSSLRDEIMAHLFVANEGEFEEAAFLFCRPSDRDGVKVLTVEDCLMLPPGHFASRSKYYLELSDETRQSIIKKAHESGLSIVEIHSHPGQATAGFSPRDISGFEEFVPHIRWRLSARPYAAVVFGTSSFDSLIWTKGNDPDGWCSILVDGKTRYEPTGYSFKRLQESEEHDCQRTT